MTSDSLAKSLVVLYQSLETGWKVRVATALLFGLVGTFWLVWDWVNGDFWGGVSSLLAAWGCSGLLLGLFVDWKSTGLAVVWGWAFGAASAAATLGHPALSIDVQRAAVESSAFLQDVATGQGEFFHLPYAIQRQAGELLSAGVCGAAVDPGLGIDLASKWWSVLRMGPETTVVARLLGFPASTPQHRCIEAKSNVLRQVGALGSPTR